MEDALDQVLFVVDDKTFEQLTELLDAPPATNARLERLMAWRHPGPHT
jgi:uncharacterized protein (DUF1778 family)